MAAHGLIINPAKHQFGLPVLVFLRHYISVVGEVPLPDRTVSDFPHPTSIKALQGFLGMVNFYNRFLPRAAHLLQPLYGTLKGKNANVDWVPERLWAFCKAKSTLANAALLAHLSPLAQNALTTDASDGAVGTMLEKWVSGVWHPLAFFSCRPMSLWMIK